MSMQSVDPTLKEKMYKNKRWQRIANTIVQQTGNLKQSQMSADRYSKPMPQKRI